jgi:hypothetical protein
MPLSPRLAASFALLLGLASVGPVVACGSSDGGGASPTKEDPPPDTTPEETDGAAPDDAGTDATPPKPPLKATFPSVESRGGKTIAKPRVVPIVFAGDPLAPQITSFTQKIATSQYWKNVGAEYGVGPMTAAPTVTIAQAPGANLTSSQIEQWLASKLSGPTPEIEAADENTLYAIYYPAGVTITLEGGGPYGQSCQGYGGYHFEIQAGAKKVGYAVMPRCSDIDELTVAASHEYFEWATDPFPESSPAYSKLDDAHWAWQALMIGELSDMCTFLDQENLRPTEIGFLVQRHWSNQLSLGGKYPCAPAKTAPYLQGIPLVDDDTIVPDYRTQQYLKTKAARVTPGATEEFDVLVYSDQPGTQQVPMRAMSIDEIYGQPSKSGFSYKLSSSYGKVGSTMKLSITAPSKTSFDILVMLTYTGNQSAHMWPVLVTNDDGKGIRAASLGPAAIPKAVDTALARALGRGPRLTRLGMGRPGLPLAPHR